MIFDFVWGIVKLILLLLWIGFACGVVVFIYMVIDAAQKMS